MTPGQVAASTAATRCPKCGYFRRASEAAPAWQCPACGIAYNKDAAYLARLQARADVPDPTDPTPAVKRQTAIFFAVHYAFFHVGYLLFLVTSNKAGPLFDGWFWLCMVAFGLDHIWSHRDRSALDRQATPTSAP